jgi:hypothetical protein
MRLTILAWLKSAAHPATVSRDRWFRANRDQSRRGHYLRSAEQGPNISDVPHYASALRGFDGVERGDAKRAPLKFKLDTTRGRYG